MQKFIQIYCRIDIQIDILSLDLGPINNVGRYDQMNLYFEAHYWVPPQYVEHFFSWGGQKETRKIFNQYKV